MKRNIFKTIFSVTGVIIAAKLLGFVKQAVTASLFGATLETDLVTLAEGLLGNLDYVLVQILLTSFTSVYIHMQDREENETYSIVSDTIKAFAMIAALVAVVAFIAAPLAARILAPSYGSNDLTRLTNYMRIYLPLLPLFAFSAVFTSLLNAHKRFLPAELVSINQSIIILAAVLLFHNYLYEQSLILAFFLYTIWNLLFLGFLSRRYWHLKLVGNPFSNPHVQALLRMCAPLLLSYSMVFIGQQVDRRLSSGLGAGAVTALWYGSSLANLVTTFIVSFSSILFTYTASAISEGDHEGAAVLVTRATGLLSLVFLPINLLAVYCAQDIVTIVYGRGMFDAQAVESAAQALQGYGFLFLPLILREVYTRFQYGYQDTRRPTIASSIGIACNILLSILFSKFWGIFGIAFATSVSVLVCGGLNLFSSRSLNRFLHFGSLLHYLPWVVLAGGGCLVAAQWIHRLLSESSAFFRFFATAACGLGAYFLLTIPIWMKLLKKELLSFDKKSTK